jgi:uncharacterized protein (DUF433 family)
MPAIRNTKIMVEHIVDMVAEGVTFEQITETYPALVIEDCKQAIMYSLEKAAAVCDEIFDEVIGEEELTPEMVRVRVRKEE